MFQIVRRFRIRTLVQPLKIGNNKLNRVNTDTLSHRERQKNLHRNSRSYQLQGWSMSEKSTISSLILEENRIFLLFVDSVPLSWSSSSSFSYLMQKVDEIKVHRQQCQDIMGCAEKRRQSNGLFFFSWSVTSRDMCFRLRCHGKECLHQNEQCSFQSEPNAQTSRSEMMILSL